MRSVMDIILNILVVIGISGFMIGLNIGVKYICRSVLEKVR